MIARSKSHLRFYSACVISAIAVGLGAASFSLLADDKPEPVKVDWSAKDTAGKDVKVPAANKTTVLVFALAEQTQSDQAIAQAKTTIAASDPAAQTILVLTGPQADTVAAKLSKDPAWAWPIVIDKDYAASGRMSVHVWPTTLVVSAAGEQLAHLPGLPPSYGKQLAAHLAFASGKIDKAQLEQQLAAEHVVVGTTEQRAERHLLVAERLMAKGLVEQARDELAKGLQLRPADSALQLGMVRVLVLLGQPEQALAALEKVDVSSVPGWQVALWRGRVLMAMDKWDQAAAVLAGATRLNPQPAEAYYAIGLVYQHQGQWQRAAESFRQAFEATTTGREASLSPVTQPTTRGE